MKRLLLILALSLIATSASAQTLVEHYVKAMTARGESDFQTYYDEMLAAHELHPGHLILQVHLARACAQLGQLDEAQSWLDRFFAQGAWIEVDEDEWLAPLKVEEEDKDPNNLTDYAVESVEEAVSRQASTLVYTGLSLDEYDLVPEGMAYDPAEEKIYLSSVHKRKIIRTDLKGNAEDFIMPRADGYLSGLGVAIDVQRRRLWSVSEAFEGSAEFEDSELGTTFVHCWSLADGRLKGKWSAPADSARHGFNDVCIMPDGSAMVSDSTGGAIYQAKLGTEVLVEILAPESLRGPNGLCVSDDGKTLYVSEYSYGIAVVDLETREHHRLKTEEPVSALGVDGLYYRQGKLIAVQNMAGLNRSVVFDHDGERITGHKVLIARSTLMDDPTTGAIIDDEFWFIANSHVSGFKIDEPIPQEHVWNKVLLFRSKL